MSRPGTRLRVAQLVEVLCPGGAEALAVDIAGVLAERGHASHLIVLRGDGPFRSRLSPAVSYHDLERPRTYGTQAERIAYMAGTAARLERLLRQERIDVLRRIPAGFFGAPANAYSGAVSAVGRSGLDLDSPVATARQRKQVVAVVDDRHGHVEPCAEQALHSDCDTDFGDITAIDSILAH